MAKLIQIALVGVHLFLSAKGATANNFARSQQSIDYASFLNEAFVAVGNAQDGRLWDYSKGSTSETKLYPTASAIKWVTSVVLLRLVHEGTMSLDDSPGQYLSYWEDEDNDITLRMLLSFTAGFRCRPLSLEVPCVYSPFSSIEACAENVYTNAGILLDEPGTTYFYGPCHMLTAAAMAQEATGQSWQEIFDTQVGTDLGMTSTVYKNNANVAGGAEFSGNDLEVFLRAMLSRDTDFLSAELWEEMVRDQTSTPVTFSYTPVPDKYPFHYGLGVWRECLADEFDASCEEVNVVSTTGSFGVSGWVDYENGIYGLIMTNLDLGGAQDVIEYSIEDLRPKILADLSAPTSEAGRRFCFSSENTVTVLDRGLVAMRDLKVGDMVHTKNGLFERVYSFGHLNHHVLVNYLQLHVSTRTDPLELTKDHLVFVKDSISSSAIAVPASNIRVGDVLLSSSSKAEGLVVVKIETIVRKGFYAPFTQSGVIDVNGVLASNYVAPQENSSFLRIGGYTTTVSNHWLFHLVLTPYRMLCGQAWSRRLCEIEEDRQGDVPVLLQYPFQVMEWFMMESR